MSGWSPNYFRPQLVRVANTILSRKVLSHPTLVITPDRWLADFATLETSDEIRPLILKDSTVMLGLR